MSTCSKCGSELPEAALFCPECGASVADNTVQPGMSPSHFNSVITSTSPPLVTGSTTPPSDPGFPAPPPPFPDEGKRSSGRKRLVLAIIAILAVLLVGATVESGMLGPPAAEPVVNSASTPLTGGQLYTAYASNQSRADASYTNKTVYIQDSLDFGVGTDLNTGQYYSSVDSGNVILFWNSQAQLGQLVAGTTVLAKCSVGGVQFSPGSGNLLILNDCALVSVQQATTAASVSAANV